MYGLITNRLYEVANQPTPSVSMGATILMFSDRYAATIVKVTACTVTVQRDRATRTDNNGMCENQEYSYKPDPSGQITVFRKTKRGWRNSQTNAGLLIGQRNEHYDYSF